VSRPEAEVVAAVPAEDRLDHFTCPGVYDAEVATSVVVYLKLSMQGAHS
jgi:hypothetical protein